MLSPASVTVGVDLAAAKAGTAAADISTAVQALSSSSAADAAASEGVPHPDRLMSRSYFPAKLLDSRRRCPQLSHSRCSPITRDELEQHFSEEEKEELLSVTPGITGLWQISGRSNITDFDEVVKLDTKYIYDWSPGLDLRILLKTFGAVFKKNGAM